MSSALKRPAPRHHDLDALRSLLMIWGIAVHTSTLGEYSSFQTLAHASGYVRMEAFFVISGLFSALLLHRYGAGLSIRRRLMVLGVPLLTMQLIVNPITNQLIFHYHNPASILLDPGARPRGPMVWHLHLWFLMALVVYTLLTPVVSHVVKACEPITGWLSRLDPALGMALLSGGAASAVLGARVVHEAFLESAVPPQLLFVVRSTLCYLPFFMLGCALFRQPALMQMFARAHWLHLTLAGLMVGAANLYFSALPKALAEAGKLWSEAFLAVTLSGGLFALARNYFQQPRQWAKVCSEAAYTIYLLHFIVTYLIAWAVRPLLGDTLLLLCVVMVLTFFATLALHLYVIAPVPVLRFLFNGRLDTPQRPTPPASEEPEAVPAPALPISRA